MNIILPQIITQDIIIKCVGSLTTSIISSYNLYNIITTHHSLPQSDYQHYQSKIISTDLANKLLLASSIIKDIVKKYHFETKSNMSIENIIELYRDELKINIEKDEDNNEFNIITHIQNNNIISNVPEPVKISLNTTLEIIEKINNILSTIHIKIKNHSESYVKYISKLNLFDDTNELIELDKIFDKRFSLLLEILKIYPNVINQTSLHAF